MENRNSNNNSNHKKPQNINKSKGPKRKNSFAIFYIITMVIGIVVCVTLFVLAYQTLVPERIVGGGTSGGNQQDQNVFVRAEYEQIMGMVTEIDIFTPGSITVQLLDTGRLDRFNIGSNAQATDRRGNPMGFGEITPGQIVDITFNADTRDMVAIALSPRAWEQQPSNFVIDLADTTITVGNRTYNYSSRTLVLHRGEPSSVGIINQEDTITLIGYENKIWSIRIDSGHGFIRFDNAHHIIDGTVTVGNIIHTTLDPGRPIAAPEGIHRVIVSGQNIEPFVADVVVRQGEIQGVDLSQDVELRYGTLQLIISQPNATVLINGNPVELEHSSVEVQFGTHVLRVELDGFIPVQEEIEMDMPFMRREINLVSDVQDASIFIQTFPSEAQIFAGEVFLGHSPLTVELEFGGHTITARRNGYTDSSIHVVVDVGSPRQYTLTLQQLPMQPPTTTFPPHGGQPYLPPIDPGHTPIPSPTIPPDWVHPGEMVPTQPLPQPLPPQQPPQQQPPFDPPPAWPPSVEDLPVPGAGGSVEL